jgi:hypothetical protein
VVGEEDKHLVLLGIQDIAGRQELDRNSAVSWLQPVKNDEPNNNEKPQDCVP